MFQRMAEPLGSQADLQSEPGELDFEVNIGQRLKHNRENVAAPARVLLFRKAIAD